MLPLLVPVIGGSKITLTAGAGGTPFFYRGYTTEALTPGSPLGSISPVVELAGHPIAGIVSQSSPNVDLAVYLDEEGGGLIPQSAWSTILITDSTGAWRTYHTADAGTHSGGSGITVWMWGAGTDDVIISGVYFFRAG